MRKLLVLCLSLASCASTLTGDAANAEIQRKAHLTLDIATCGLAAQKAFEASGKTPQDVEQLTLAAAYCADTAVAAYLANAPKPIVEAK
jgi:hypothetical protein